MRKVVGALVGLGIGQLGSSFVASWAAELLRWTVLEADWGELGWDLPCCGGVAFGAVSVVAMIATIASTDAVGRILSSGRRSRRFRGVKVMIQRFATKRRPERTGELVNWWCCGHNRV